MKTHHLNRLPSLLRIAGAVTLMSAAAAMAFVAAKQSASHAKPSLSDLRVLHRRDAFETSQGGLNRSRSGEPESSRIHNGRAQEQYDNRAYPRKWIDAAQQVTAANAANAIAALSPALAAAWAELGPSGVPASATVAGESTGATAGTIYSGRTTAIAVDPNCSLASCTVFIGAAGGGVWKTTNALAATPSWSQVSDGQIPSNAIGSLAFDASGNLYAGTGEPNGSSDSEAGVGLYKSTDGGSTWTLLSGSTALTAPCAANPASPTCPVATDRSIGAIAIDPVDTNHIFIGTDVARHGSSSVNGGRFTPPGAAQAGLHESPTRATTCTAVKILTQDTVAPGSANGGDFFRGGCSHIELYRPGTETQVYASFFDYGVFRRSTLDGAGFHQIFGSLGGGSVGLSSFFRTEFSLAPNGSNLRIYVGDGGAPPPTLPDGFQARFFRVDNANVAAATLFTGGTNGGWTLLSNSTPGTSGFSSFNYCTTQCTYDMPVYSPPGAPNIVYIGGGMQYDEIFA